MSEDDDSYQQFSVKMESIWPEYTLSDVEEPSTESTRLTEHVEPSTGNHTGSVKAVTNTDEFVCMVENASSSSSSSFDYSGSVASTSQFALQSAFTQSQTMHQSTHTGENPFGYQVCGQTFNENDRPTAHRKKHTCKNPYICDVCAKVFKYKSKLIAHHRTHSGVKPYVCKVCGKKFKENIHLNTHTRMHTDEKPFVCLVCGKSFMQSFSLTKHRRSMHQRKWPLPCPCDNCHQNPCDDPHSPPAPSNTHG